jgi:hypothetical protein
LAVVAVLLRANMNPAPAIAASSISPKGHQGKVPPCADPPGGGCVPGSAGPTLGTGLGGGIMGDPASFVCTGWITGTVCCAPGTAPESSKPPGGGASDGSTGGRVATGVNGWVASSCSVGVTGWATEKLVAASTRTGAMLEVKSSANAKRRRAENARNVANAWRGPRRAFSLDCVSGFKRGKFLLALCCYENRASVARRVLYQ